MTDYKIKNDFGEDIEKIEVDKIPTGIDFNPASKAADIYDIVAETINNKIASRHNILYRKELNQFLRLLPPKGSIVDIGCGLGLEVAYFNSLGFSAVGIDISAKSIDLARELYPEINFILWDFSDSIIYDDLKVDGIHEHLSLMNLPKEEIKKLLVVFNNCLSNGGLLQVSFEEDNPDKTGWYSVPTTDSFEMNGETIRLIKFIYLSYYSIDELKHTVEEAGFNIISIKIHKEEDRQRKIITVLCKNDRITAF